jgi:hypothetical protein
MDALPKDVKSLDGRLETVIANAVLPRTSPL